ncbi:MAG: alpha/beta hydrolase, partial [Mycobacteriaceae bacterium]|nr:alpha/beta hydrolase [Mycobacteriaceae bacterium]
MGVRWIVAGIAVVIAVVVAVVSALFTFVIVSARIPASFIQLSSVVSDYGLYLIPLGLVGILLAAVLFRSGTRRIGEVTGVFGADDTLAACVPLDAS